FRNAPNSGGRGNAEYQDVLAGGKYLQSRPDVDPNRIGIWGLSYGGVLTAQALARNSDIFKVGVDLAGVHLWGSSLDPENVSYQASAISAIDTWKSPVLLIHGDDDRNVQFSQTTGLVQLLRAHNVYHELIVFPDDTHETLLHKRWMVAFNRLDEFIARYLKPGTAATTAQRPQAESVHFEHGAEQDVRAARAAVPRRQLVGRVADPADARHEDHAHRPDERHVLRVVTGAARQPRRAEREALRRTFNRALHVG